MLGFGTDGVRGRAYEELKPAEVARLAQVAAEVMAPNGAAVIGRDTRVSGPDFANALIDGFSAAGLSTLDMGVAPTPAVAWASAKHNLLGAMVSGSHNPWTDNGIKLFSPGGGKLDDETQIALEAALNESSPLTFTGSQQVSTATELLDEYQDELAATVKIPQGSGLNIVVDAANGSATSVLPGPFVAHGIGITVINADPDGRNINHHCGSTHPESVAKAVLQQKADLGLTFDGDADRVLAVDHTGELVDGDQIIAICAADRHQRGDLNGDTVVVTVMSNLGFHRAMAQQGIQVITTPVGDRHVWSALRKGGWSLGGEQSGHVIFPELATTGDGLITALQLLEVIARRGVPLRDLQAMTRMPQVLHNVTAPSVDHTHLEKAIAAAEQTLGAHGRVLVRHSGTEPVIRVMVEAETHETAESIATELIASIRPLNGASR